MQLSALTDSGMSPQVARCSHDELDISAMELHVCSAKVKRAVKRRRHQDIKRSQYERGLEMKSTAGHAQRAPRQTSSSSASPLHGRARASVRALLARGDLCGNDDMPIVALPPGCLKAAYRPSQCVRVTPSVAPFSSSLPEVDDMPEDPKGDTHVAKPERKQQLMVDLRRRFRLLNDAKERSEAMRARCQAEASGASTASTAGASRSCSEVDLDVHSWEIIHDNLDCELEVEPCWSVVA